MALNFKSFALCRTATRGRLAAAAAVAVRPNHQRLPQRARAFTSGAKSKTNTNERTKVTVKVPATSANMGPGYDSLGVCIDMWNYITVERVKDDTSAFHMEVNGEGADVIPKTTNNLVCQGVQKALDYAKRDDIDMRTLRFKLDNSIPYARGFGSSSAAIVGGIIAGLAIAGKELSVWGHNKARGGAGFNSSFVEPEELLQLAAGMEGHPDNVTPCIYGGVQLGCQVNPKGGATQWHSARVGFPQDMILVAYVPHIDSVRSIPDKTQKLRQAVPKTLSVEDVVYQTQRIAFLINALNQGNYGDIRWGMMDRLHQPQRGEKVWTHMQPVIDAAIEAGAIGGYLSGAGPTILALVHGHAGDIFTQHSFEHTARTVADAMHSVGSKCDGGKWAGEVFITAPSHTGAQIVFAEPPYSDSVRRFVGGDVLR